MILSQVTPLLSQSPTAKRVALQFPDHLLPQSTEIFFHLQTANSPRHSFFILADTSFGSCCVDEVAADHVDADLLIHFGSACFSPPSRIEVWWVVDEIALETCSAFDLSFEGSVIVLSDAKISNYSQVAKANWIEAKIVDKFTPNDPQSLQEECRFYGRELERALAPEEAYCVLFVGEASSSTYAHLMLTEAASKGTPVFHLEVQRESSANSAGSCSPQAPSSCRPFVKRLRCIEQIKPAQIFGLLLGTASTKGTLEMLAQVKSILKAAGKHYYTFYLGKLNAPKLGNFLEIDAFVWIGCPQARLIYDSEFYAEFRRPVVTPVELAICLQQNGEPFGGIRYCLDFEGFLKEQKIIKQREEEGEKGASDDNHVLPVDLTNRKMALVASKRQFQGLAYEVDEQQRQETEIKEGRSGIARGYANE